MPPKKSGKGGGGTHNSSNSNTTTAGDDVAAHEPQLWKAIRNGDADTLRRLLFYTTAAGQQLPHLSARGWLRTVHPKRGLPLHAAVEAGAGAEVLEVLVAAGADVDARPSGRAPGAPALVEACWAEDDAAVQTLLLACGADPAAADADGRTALHVTAATGAAGLAEYILDFAGQQQQQARLLHAADAQGFTPLHTALAEVGGGGGGREAVAGLLLERAAQAGGGERGLWRGTAGTTSLLHALLGTPGVGEGAALPGVVRRVLGLGVDAALADEEGRTALSYAALHLTEAAVATPVVAMLLDAVLGAAGSDGNGSSGSGATAAVPSVSLAELLRQRDAGGAAFIHLAIAVRNAAAVEAVLAYADAHPAALSAADARACLAELPLPPAAAAAPGEGPCGLLARTPGGEALAAVLRARGLLDADAYASLKAAANAAAERRREEQTQQRSAAAAAAAAASEAARGDYSGHGSGAGGKERDLAAAAAEAARRHTAAKKAQREQRRAERAAEAAATSGGAAAGAESESEDDKDTAGGGGRAGAEGKTATSRARGHHAGAPPSSQQRRGGADSRSGSAVSAPMIVLGALLVLALVLSFSGLLERTDPRRP